MQRYVRQASVEILNNVFLVVGFHFRKGKSSILDRKLFDEFYLIRKIESFDGFSGIGRMLRLKFGGSQAVDFDIFRAIFLF